MGMIGYICRDCKTYINVENGNNHECTTKEAKRSLIGGFPNIARPFESYESPATGEWIGSHMARRDDLKKSGCVEYEPGMRQDCDARVVREEAELDRMVEHTVEKEMEGMSSEKLDSLGKELATSEIEYERL